MIVNLILRNTELVCLFDANRNGKVSSNEVRSRKALTILDVQTHASVVISALLTGPCNQRRFVSLAGNGLCSILLG